jgi:hypothetical protein
MSLIVEWNASANMFYLFKNLLLLINVIFKLKCNNLIFNEIMVLNASYVCLHAFSLRRESPDPDPGRRTPHFWGGSVTRVSRSQADFDMAATASSWASRPKVHHSSSTFVRGILAAAVGTSTWKASPAVGNTSIDDIDVVSTFFFATDGKTHICAFQFLYS